MSKETLKLALDALENVEHISGSTDWFDDCVAAALAIKEELAKQEGQSNFCPQCEALARELKAVKQEQSEPVAEKVYDPEDDTAYIQYFIPHDLIPVGTKFYTTPQQRKPLTDEQIKRIWESLPFCNGAWETFARRIEAAHGIAPQDKPAYKDSTPHLSVGDSAFESWYSEYNPSNKGDKQRSRDAYAAGMGDPLVVSVPEGWKLVPVKLTQEMKKAWVVSLTPTDAWAAMLEAAPQGSDK